LVRARLNLNHAFFHGFTPEFPGGFSSGGARRYVFIAAIFGHSLNPQNPLGACYYADYKGDSGEFTRSFDFGRIVRRECAWGQRGSGRLGTGDEGGSLAAGWQGQTPDHPELQQLPSVGGSVEEKSGVKILAGADLGEARQGIPVPEPAPARESVGTGAPTPAP